MPTIFSHAVAATAAAQWLRRPLPRTFWAWTIVCAMLPDVDVIGFSFGIQYGDMFGHRGFTHSFFFAVLLGLVAARANSLGAGRWKLGVLWLWFAVGSPGTELEFAL